MPVPTLKLVPFKKHFQPFPGPLLQENISLLWEPTYVVFVCSSSTSLILMLYDIMCLYYVQSTAKGFSFVLLRRHIAYRHSRFSPSKHIWCKFSNNWSWVILMMVFVCHQLLPAAIKILNWIASFCSDVLLLFSQSELPIRLPFRVLDLFMHTTGFILIFRPEDYQLTFPSLHKCLSTEWPHFCHPPNWCFYIKQGNTQQTSQNLLW